MSTPAQIAANQANSQLSTGPKSETGKAAAARNNFRHGLSTSTEFWVLPSERQTDFLKLLAQFQQEHQPETPTEEALVQAMAEHHWLRHRAMRLEEACFDYTTGQIIDERKLALYLRYQTTHERAFHKALNDLLKLRAEKRKQEIGFERQQHAQADQIRRQERHEMKKERHKWEILLAEVKVDAQQLRDLAESERLLAEMNRA
ncbi:MAG TPA: hypothetical protein VH369_12250 [Bryobacteraceae bacterium]|jgi:hypothetical protein